MHSKPTLLIRSLLKYLLLALVLLYPAFLLRHPIASPDSPAYYKAGDAAVRTVKHIAARIINQTAASESDLQPAKSPMFKGVGAAYVPDTAVGIRSPYYGLFIRALSYPSLWVTIVVQALLTVYAIERFCSGFDIGPTAQRVIYILASVSTLPWFVCYLQPDLFGGLLFLLLGVILFATKQTTRTILCFDYTIILFSLVAHTANLLILACVTILLLLAKFAARLLSFNFLTVSRIVAVVAVCLSALVLDIVANYIAFGSPTITARAPPFLLARSVADGAGRLYLQEICPTQSSKFAVCNYIDKLSDDANFFLWNPDGVYMAASPSERQNMRTEQKEIVVKAAIAHPLIQFSASLKNFIRMLVDFDLRAVRTDLDWKNGIESGAFTSEQPVVVAVLKHISTALTYLTVSGSLAAILFLALRSRLKPFPELMAFYLTCVVINAAVTGVLSGVSSRYEARIIWIIPLIAVLSLYKNTAIRGEAAAL